MVIQGDPVIPGAEGGAEGGREGAWVRVGRGTGKKGKKALRMISKLAETRIEIGVDEHLTWIFSPCFFLHVSVKIC